MSYVANTDAERQQMLAAVGVESIDALFADVPARVRNPRLDLPPALTEPALLDHLRCLAERNADLLHHPTFLGAGVYNHFIPSVVGYVTGRAEFSTSYTPYQPEVSQGNLQAIYEYQTLVCMLTGLEVANASMYDGATAVAEAAIMAINLTGRGRVVLSPTLHPEYQSTTRSYLAGQAATVETLTFAANSVGWQRTTSAGARAPADEPAQVAAALDAESACLVIQQPNFLGQIENIPALAEAAHAAGALLVVCVNPIALGLLQAPGKQGADIVVGEGQPLGLATSFGGPYLGLFACKQAHIRQMPGRVVGATVDTAGRPGYVLTFQTREQHIRREKATSNICSNEALCALAAAVYLGWVGPRGLRQIAETCLQRAHFVADKISALPGFDLAFPGAPFFHEFAISCPVSPAEVNRHLLTRGIIGGYELARAYPGDPRFADLLLLCVTELNSPSELDLLVAALAELSDGKATRPMRTASREAAR